MKLRTYFYISALMSILLLMSCSKDEAVKQEIIRPVRYQQVLLSGSGQSRSFSGISKAGTEAKLSFRVAGSLNSVKTKVGDHLNKGDLIASVDDTDAKLNYEKSLVALDKSTIQKETAKSSLIRIKGLYENNNVSLQDYEKAKTNYATTNAAYNADKKNVDLQKHSLDYFNLYSPISGIVTTVNAEINENINRGQVIAIINAVDDIELEVGMPESYISKVKTKNNVTVNFPSIPGKVFDGIISEVAYNIGSKSATYPVTVVLTAPTQEIRPGMSATVNFIFGNNSDIQLTKIIAPVSAVGKDTKGNFVYVLNKKSESYYEVEKRIITVGKLLTEGFEIINGVSENELVATAGLNSLMDGMKVRLLNK